MKLSTLEQWKLNRLQAKLGKIESSDEALQLAIEAERIKKDCGPWGPHFPYFAQSQIDLEQLATLLEKQSHDPQVCS